MTENSHQCPGQNSAGGDRAADGLSRRDFLNTAGSAAMGGLVAAAGGSIFAGKKAMAAEAPEAPPLPWKYVKLDPMEAGKRGYHNYLEKGG